MMSMVFSPFSLKWYKFTTKKCAKQSRIPNLLLLSINCSFKTFTKQGKIAQTCKSRKICSGLEEDLKPLPISSSMLTFRYFWSGKNVLMAGKWFLWERWNWTEFHLSLFGRLKFLQNQNNKFCLILLHLCNFELSLVIEIWDWLDGKLILNSWNPSPLEFFGLAAYSNETG